MTFTDRQRTLSSEEGATPVQQEESGLAILGTEADGVDSGTSPGPLPMRYPDVDRGHGMRRIPTIILVVTITTMLIGAGIAYSADRTVRTRGDNTMIPNALIQSTLKFTPGNTVVRTGDTVTWVHADKTTEPHTITIVNEEELPQTIEEVFEPDCPSCDVAAQGHFVQGLAFVDVDGDGGLSTPGDSLFLPPGDDVSAQITGEPGDDLSYLCIIHPWMQGRIDIRG